MSRDSCQVFEGVAVALAAQGRREVERQRREHRCTPPDCVLCALLARARELLRLPG
jgi:hypothetical protein